MIGQDKVFSTGKDTWGTPLWLYDLRNDIHKFTIDLAASPENAKCVRYYTEEDDSLQQSWRWERGWLNPPYSIAKKFIRKAYEETVGQWQRWGRDGPSAELVEMLLAARTSNQEWHDYIFPGASEIVFIRGRIIFEGALLGAPFPSALVTFRKGPPPVRPIITTLDAREYQARIKGHDRSSAIGEATSVLHNVLDQRGFGSETEVQAPEGATRIILP